MKTKPAIALVSAEMEKIFVERSEHHRLLVKKNLLNMRGYLDLSYDLLNKAADAHDQSKYMEPERSAYIWMTWMFYCQNNEIEFKYPDGIETLVQQGWSHHIVNNSHHPEAHEYLDAMSNLDIVEMVCDWTAISQEGKPVNNSCMLWAVANIDKKWNFSLAKKNLIFATIRELDKRNQASINSQGEFCVESVG